MFGEKKNHFLLVEIKGTTLKKILKIINDNLNVIIKNNDFAMRKFVYKRINDFFDKRELIKKYESNQ